MDLTCFLKQALPSAKIIWMQIYTSANFSQTSSTSQQYKTHNSYAMVSLGTCAMQDKWKSYWREVFHFHREL